MIQLRNLLISLLFILAACSSDGNPMAGEWTRTDAPGMQIDFDAYSDAIAVHLGDPNGAHDHAHGKNTYTYDDKTKVLTVYSELMGHGKADTWTGKVDGQTFELGAADIKLKFRKGGTAGH